MGRNVIETVMGAVVLLVAAGFLTFAYKSSTMGDLSDKSDSYALSAKFDNATGLNPGSDVRMAGVKVGAVERMTLDPNTFQAVVTLRLADNIKLPLDSTASIVSSGLLGDKFVSVEAGGEEASLGDGQEIKYTQSSVSFEELLGKFVFSSGGVDKGEASDQGESTEGAADAPAAHEAPASDNPASLGIQ